MADSRRMRRVLRKHAAGGSALREAGKGALTGAAAMGTAVAVAAGIEGVSRLWEAAKKKSNFSSMMAANTDLAGQQQKDPKFFRTAYGALAQTNPTFAENPLIAGALMRRMTENPETAGTILASTVKTPDAGGRANVGLSTQAAMGPVSFRSGYGR